MKARSDIMPHELLIEKYVGVSRLRFAENIVEKKTDDEHIYFEYDEYVFETIERKGLEEEIQGNFNVWLDMAKAREEIILRDLYRHKTQEFIRQSYSEHDEAKLLNEALMDNIEGREISVDYINYRHYIEECKEKARQLVYI
jgi:hypothetical protein